MPISDPEKRREAQHRYYKENKERWEKYQTDERRAYMREYGRTRTNRKPEDPEKRNVIKGGTYAPLAG